MTASETSARNYAYFKAFAKQEVEAKCYTCDKWTLNGKTCIGECDRE